MTIRNDHDTAPASASVELVDLSGGKYSAEWWKDTADRVVSTTAQAGIAALTAGATGLLDVSWPAVGSIAGLAGVVAFLKALGTTRA